MFRDIFHKLFAALRTLFLILTSPLYNPRAKYCPSLVQLQHVMRLLTLCFVTFFTNFSVPYEPYFWYWRVHYTTPELSIAHHWSSYSTLYDCWLYVSWHFSVPETTILQHIISHKQSVINIISLLCFKSKISVFMKVYFSYRTIGLVSFNILLDPIRDLPDNIILMWNYNKVWTDGRTDRRTRWLL